MRLVLAIIAYPAKQCDGSHKSHLKEVSKWSRWQSRAVSGPSARRPRNSVKASPEGAFTPRRRDRRTAHAHFTAAD